MARRGALTALQAALAGVSGGAQGYIQQRELERKREQEKADRERQQAIDVMGLQERGYTTAEQYAKQRQGATARGGQVASQALLSALNPMAGAPPVAQVTGEGVSALSRALAMPEEPVQRVAFGGQEFVRAESPLAREERLGLLAQERQAMTTREAQRARATEQQAERDFQREQAKARQAFDAVQNRLEREAQASRDAMRLMAEGGARRPTEAQERNAVYYNLMSNAQSELDALRGNPEIRPWAITAYLNTPGAQFGRGLLSDAEQQFIRAAQDFTAGILRKETGAAATRSEVAQTLERYIEMGGEQPGSAQAKSDARRRVTEAMQTSAMPALQYAQRFAAPSPAQSQAATSRPPLSSFRRP